MSGQVGPDAGGFSQPAPQAACRASRAEQRADRHVERRRRLTARPRSRRRPGPPSSTHCGRGRPGTRPYKPAPTWPGCGRRGRRGRTRQRPGAPDGAPHPPVSVRVGDEVAVTLHGSPAYGWAPVDVAAGLLEVVEAGAPDGTARALVRAVGPGGGTAVDVVVSPGDGFGPQTGYCLRTGRTGRWGMSLDAVVCGWVPGARRSTRPSHSMRGFLRLRYTDVADAPISPIHRYRGIPVSLLSVDCSS